MFSSSSGAVSGALHFRIPGFPASYLPWYQTPQLQKERRKRPGAAEDGTGGAVQAPPICAVLLSRVYWWSGVFSVVVCSCCHLRSSWSSLERPCFSRKCLISPLDGLGSPLTPVKLQGFPGLHPHFLSHCPFNFGN